MPSSFATGGASGTDFCCPRKLFSTVGTPGTLDSIEIPPLYFARSLDERPWVRVAIAGAGPRDREYGGATVDRSQLGSDGGGKMITGAGKNKDRSKFRTLSELNQLTYLALLGLLLHVPWAYDSWMEPRLMGLGTLEAPMQRLDYPTHAG